MLGWNVYIYIKRDKKTYILALVDCEGHLIDVSFHLKRIFHTLAIIGGYSELRVRLDKEAFVSYRRLATRVIKLERLSNLRAPESVIEDVTEAIVNARQEIVNAFGAVNDGILVATMERELVKTYTIQMVHPCESCDSASDCFDTGKVREDCQHYREPSDVTHGQAESTLHQTLIDLQQKYGIDRE